MASKRPGNSNYDRNQQISRKKIQKLDISIISSSSTTTNVPRSTFVRPMVPNISRLSAPQQPPPTKQKPGIANRIPQSSSSASKNVAKFNSVDMWGDDDDEFIMLASQVAEQVETYSQDIIINTMDISFDGFSRVAKSSLQSTQMSNNNHPTQIQQPTPVEPTTEPPGYPINNGQNGQSSKNQQILDDFDDECFIEYPDLVENNGIDKKIIDDQNKNGCKIQKHRDNAKEIQLELLLKQLNDTKLENCRLQQEIGKLSEKCQTKDGEIAIVRYELQNNKHMQQEMRDKFRDELGVLKQQNKEQQSELQFKNLEIITAKSRFPMDGVSHIQQTKAAHEFLPIIQKNKQNKSLKLLILHLNILDFHYYHTDDCQNANFNSEIFENSMKIFRQNDKIEKRRFILTADNNRTEELIILLQNKLAQLMMAIKRRKNNQLKKFTNENHEEKQKSTELLIDTFEQIANELGNKFLSKISQTMAASSSDHSNRQQQEKLIYDYDAPEIRQIKYESLNSSIYQMDEMFCGEHMLLERRLLAGFSIVCNISKLFCDFIIFQPMENGKSFCELLTEFFLTLGNSSTADWKHYGGHLEASSKILTNIIRHYNTENTKRDEILQNLFHSIILCRPIGGSLCEISRFLLQISRKFEKFEFLDKMCKKSSDYVIRNKMLKKIQFKLSTCTLQLYAVQLQCEFPTYDEKLQINSQQFNNLIEITERTLQLLSNCLKKPVNWIFRVSSSSLTCPCYVQLVCACIVLLHLVLHHWIDNPKLINPRQIATITKQGILFIHDYFVVNYESIVLRVGGPAVRQRLLCIFCWIHEHYQLFNFQKSHIKAIDAIGFLRRIPHMVELLKSTDGGGGGGDSACVSGDGGGDADFENKPDDATDHNEIHPTNEHQCRDKANKMWADTFDNFF